MKGIYHLRGTVKNYEWGGFHWLPSLLHQENAGKIPYAEYWLGTHPSGPAMVKRKATEEVPLQQVAGDLPFLLKLLDVREMLSIQVHPTARAARSEFERENEQGLDMNDPRRNYPDPHDKPELMVALTDFWLLQGFKPGEQLHDILVNVPELAGLLGFFKQSSYRNLYSHVMTMPQAEVNRILAPLAGKIVPAFENGDLEKTSEDYWAARALLRFRNGGDYDRGIFSIYLMNLVKLEKGEGIFQAPGILHAYLEGRNVEIMGNSDNVLRGGLTTKPIQIPELMKHVRFEALHPGVIYPSTDATNRNYITPGAPFALAMVGPGADEARAFAAGENEILLLAEGSAQIDANGESLTLGEGDIAVWISAGTNYRIDRSPGALIFRARAGQSIHS